MGKTKDDSAEGRRARAEAAFAKQQVRDEQTTTREREEAARVAALDEKTARLRAMRLAREAEEKAGPAGEGQGMIYRLRAVRREPDGLITPPLHEHLITAADTAEAVRLARAVDIDMDAVEANALFLSDEAGNVLWSLRRLDIGA